MQPAKYITTIQFLDVKGNVVAERQWMADKKPSNKDIKSLAAKARIVYFRWRHAPNSTFDLPDTQ